MKIGERIKRRREELGLSADQVAEKIGKNRATVYRYESNDIKNFPIEVLTPLADVLKTTPAYLMGWDLGDDAFPANIMPVPEMRKIPLIGSIACGAPILAEEHIEEYINIPKHITNADFALSCKGDSMINARIFDGDIVYIRQQDMVDNGDIAAVLIDGEATLKRFRLLPDRIILEPENPLYDPLVYRGEEMNTVRVLGKAVAFTSAIR